MQDRISEKHWPGQKGLWSYRIPLAKRSEAARDVCFTRNKRYPLRRSGWQTSMVQSGEGASRMAGIKGQKYSELFFTCEGTTICWRLEGKRKPSIISQPTRCIHTATSHHTYDAPFEHPLEGISSSSSTTNPSLLSFLSPQSQHAQVAAEQALRTTLSAALKKKHKKQRMKPSTRRQRARLSRAFSSAARARRCASLRARHKIQAFGWNSSQAELTSKVTTPNTGSNASSKPSSKPRTIIRKSRETPIDSTDGAGASALRPVKQQKTHLENLYSLMHVTEVPIYWTPS